MAQDHSDWHAIARMEGVNAWDCPFDCMDFDEDDEGPTVFALIWRPPVRKGTFDFDAEPYGYPVFSMSQARTYASVLAERIGRSVKVEIVR